ncbi:MAG: hypothetical protein ABIE55_02995 [Candidatus Aenigmatarchaeota archaeon]
MRFHFLALALILVFSATVFAQEPTMEIYTDRSTYLAGEIGTIRIEIESFGRISEAEIELEILSPGGVPIFGDIIYTKIPSEIVLNENTGQTVQTLYKDTIDFMGPEKSVVKNINFEVPINAEEGVYTLFMRLTSPGLTLHKANYLFISGGGEIVDVVIIIYIIILIFSLYLVWRG